MPAGRPTKYRPEFCDEVIEYGRSGKSRTWMCAELGISRQTLFDWEKAHPEFLDAMGTAGALSQQWWEDAGQNGMTADKFNASVWSRSMAARFPEDWREKQEVEHTGLNTLAEAILARRAKVASFNEGNGGDEA